jgi:hypothetical protein
MAVYRKRKMVIPLLTAIMDTDVVQLARGQTAIVDSDMASFPPTRDAAANEVAERDVVKSHRPTPASTVPCSGTELNVQLGM